MSELRFSKSTALVLLDSPEPFPVDFDKAWQWLGYSRKDVAKRKLEADFVEGTDFLLRNKVEQKEGSGGHNEQKIKLTIDCFKSFGMMAGTEMGKQVRQYFLECEKELKHLLGEQDDLRLSSDRGERRLQLEDRARSAYTRMMHNQERLCLALSIIKEEKLWEDIVGRNGEAIYLNFSDYCETHLGIKRSNAYNKALAGDVIRSLVGIPEEWKPKSAEGWAMLNQVDEERRESILGRIADECNPPTAFNIKRAIKEMQAESLEETFNLPDSEAKYEENTVEGQSNKVEVTFLIDREMKGPLFELAKTRQMSVSTFVANLCFRELREAHGVGDIDSFLDFPKL